MSYKIMLVDDDEPSSDAVRVMATVCDPEVAEMIYQYYLNHKHSQGYRVELALKRVEYQTIKDQDIPWPKLDKTKEKFGLLPASGDFVQ